MEELPEEDKHMMKQDEQTNEEVMETNTQRRQMDFSKNTHAHTNLELTFPPVLVWGVCLGAAMVGRLRGCRISHGSVTVWSCGPPRGSRILTSTSRNAPVAFLLLSTCMVRLITVSMLMSCLFHDLFWNHKSVNCMMKTHTHTHRR